MGRIKINGHECKECGLIYKNQSTAKKCQEWCKKYKSCNLEITEYAINKRR